MVEVNGFKFNFKLTPISSVRVTHLVKDMGFNMEDVGSNDYTSFLIASMCDTPQKLLGLGLIEFSEIKKQVVETEEFKDMTAEIDRLIPSKNDKKKSEVTVEVQIGYALSQGVTYTELANMSMFDFSILCECLEDFKDFMEDGNLKMTKVKDISVIPEQEEEYELFH